MRSEAAWSGKEMWSQPLVSNSIEAVVLFLSSETVEAVFTSVGPDLGVGVCRRTVPVLRDDQAYISGVPDFPTSSV